MSQAGLRGRFIDSLKAVEASAWDACAGAENPTVSYAFLSALEDSGSATAQTGWAGRHLLVEDGGTVVGAVPAYVKSHSYGEYVFDHSWADAFERAGGRYYPKLQVSVPFTPAFGPRLLSSNPDVRAAMAGALADEVERLKLSSLHVTFPEEDDVRALNGAGYLLRHDQQFHWINQGFTRFEDFLDTLASRKRKTIRKERETARAAGLDIRWISGSDLTEAHWDALWAFYQDTGRRKWGRPYLTRAFFSLLGERMADRVLLVFAYRGPRAVAGALNLIGADRLIGRYWGCIEDHPCLHFELCYYQAIDFAIAHRLAKVEAGAQGPHKLARGYMPTQTTSAHWITNLSFRSAVAAFLERERAAVAQEISYLGQLTPYRRGPSPGHDDDHE
jgi:hypothetical protein